GGGGGGVLAGRLSWSWVFWINVPVGLAALAIGRRVLPDSRDDAAVRTVDWRGASVSTVGLVALTYALVEGNRLGWSSPVVIGALAVLVVAAVVFVLLAHPPPGPL